MIGRLIFIAALLAAPMAVAQTAPEPPPATPRQIAEARAIADRLINEADAQGIFVNKTDGAVPTVLHLASGMRCHFDGTGDRIVVFPQQNDDIPRGDDVGCIVRHEELGIDSTTYATRYRPLPSEQAVLADSVNAIRNRWPDAIPFEGTLASTTVGEFGTPKQAAFKISTAEGPMLTLVVVAHVGDWGYKVRATGPFAEPMLVSVLAGMLMANMQTGQSDLD